MLTKLTYLVLPILGAMHFFNMLINHRFVRSMIVSPDHNEISRSGREWHDV